MATTSKINNQYYEGGANIDANYGPWGSIQEYMGWLEDTLGTDEVADGTIIAVKNPQTGKISRHLYENGTWTTLLKGCVMTMEQYDALTEREPDTIYMIVNETEEDEARNL